MPTDDRDRQLERALARHLSNASPDRTCPDAEILAAYHERTLSLEEMTQWKEHIAGCARCQEAVALIEQSEDALGEKSAGEGVEVLDEEMAATAITTQAAAFGSRGAMPRAAAVPAASAVSTPGKSVAHLPWRWVVPVGALAAAVMVWIGVREVQIENKTAKQNIQVAQNREATAPPVAPAPAAPAPYDTLQQRKEPSAARSEVAQNPSNRVTPPASQVVQPPKEEQILGGLPSAPPKPGPSHQAGALKRDYRELGVPKAAPTQTPAPAADDAEKRRALDVASATPAAIGGVDGAPANQPAEMKKQKTVPQTMTETVEATAAAPTLNTSTADLQVLALNEKDLVKLAAEDRRFVVAPGQKHAWRVGDRGAILHSTDGGKTWKKQKSGVTVDLTSGTATSDQVTWVAGKNGTLLLTTDGGKHWKRITTPIKEDLGGVHAVDRTHASIWDLTNRKSFETSDGGETWKPSANE
jgi:hypothetical protein